VARFSNSNPQVDYAAIGVDVKSFKPGNQYQEMSGTSMASPHVCGFIAAVLSGWDEGWEEQTTSLEDEDERPTIRKDHRLRKYLEKKHIIDINVSGRDDDTGVGFLTFLAKEEYEGLIEQW
jgi:Subtilase family